ncbi:MAG: DUF86 domain-containing protein [Proteobacteria bacterium]|nr:DUF86 domain-containing protein [Pseudomonadota bacterium]
MVDRDIVAAKLAELSTRIERAGRHCPSSIAALAEDRDALDLVSFNLLLAVQSCLDLASHIIADEGWPPATSLAQAFRRLAEHRVLSPATATALAQAAGLRNLVAHGYSDVDVARIHQAATTGLADLRTFMHEVSVWLGASPESPA